MEQDYCNLCKFIFNLSDKLQIHTECGHSFCLTCFLKRLDPYDYTFMCPYDKKVVFQIDEDYKQKLLEKIKPEGTMILCDDHNDSTTSYCKQCNVFICNRCQKNHIDHLKSV